RTRLRATSPAWCAKSPPSAASKPLQGSSGSEGRKGGDRSPPFGVSTLIERDRPLLDVALLCSSPVLGGGQEGAQRSGVRGVSLVGRLRPPPGLPRVQGRKKASCFAGYPPPRTLPAGRSPACGRTPGTPC